MGAEFDDIYVQKRAYWGTKPSSLVKDALRYKRSGTVLDVGAGEGRNAVYLARHGFDVTAVDVSRVGLRKLRHLARSAGVQIRTIAVDIRCLPLQSHEYDMILAIAMLHFLEPASAEAVVGRLKSATRPGGINVITVMTRSRLNRRFDNAFKHGHLRRLYEDWRVLHYREGLTPWETHGNEKPHRHTVAALIAQRPLRNHRRR